MRRLADLVNFRVRILTILICLPLTSCSVIEGRYGETCKSHAYSQAILTDYITTRYLPNSPVRLAVVPSSVPANISSYNSTDRPGVGNQLAWKMHQELLNYAEVPIVEVLNREEWPGKKEEFFTGNFGAIRHARDAHYDLVLVSYVEPVKSLDTVSAFTKVIDVENGVTLYYGKSSVHTRRPRMRDAAAWFGTEERRPDLQYFNDLYDKLGWCIVKDVMAEKTTPQ